MKFAAAIADVGGGSQREVPEPTSHAHPEPSSDAKQRDRQGSHRASCRSGRLVGNAFRLRKSLLSRAWRSTIVLNVARQLLPGDGNSHPSLPLIAGRGERHAHGRLRFPLTIVRPTHSAHHAEHCEHIEERTDRTNTVIAVIAARQQNPGPN